MPIDKKLAVRLAKACLWVYDFAPAKKAKLLRVRGKRLMRVVKIEDDQNHTSFAGVMEYSDIVVVAFQGTITEFGLNGEFRLDTLIDWIQNFRVQQLKTTRTRLPGLVHKGFFGQLDLIADQVCDALPKQGNKPIVLTGHSQGGAVATLATKLLKDRGFPVRESYTFAAPRSGDAVFRKSVTTPVHRVEFGDDIVPHVPPMLADGNLLVNSLSLVPRRFVPKVLRALQDLLKRLKKQSYVGVGKLTYRDEDGKLLTDRTLAQEKTLAKRRTTRLLFAGKDLVNHHHLEHYIGMFSK